MSVRPQRNRHAHAQTISATACLVQSVAVAPVMFAASSLRQPAFDAVASATRASAGSQRWSWLSTKNLHPSPVTVPKAMKT